MEDFPNRVWEWTSVNAYGEAMWASREVTKEDIERRKKWIRRNENVDLHQEHR